MELGRMVELGILVGRLLGHLRGAWTCGCKIAVVVNATNPLDAAIDEIVSDPGF